MEVLKLDFPTLDNGVVSTFLVAVDLGVFFPWLRLVLLALVLFSLYVLRFFLTSRTRTHTYTRWLAFIL